MGFASRFWLYYIFTLQVGLIHSSKPVLFFFKQSVFNFDFIQLGFPTSKEQAGENAKLEKALRQARRLKSHPLLLERFGILKKSLT